MEIGIELNWPESILGCVIAICITTAICSAFETWRVAISDCDCEEEETPNELD